MAEEHEILAADIETWAERYVLSCDLKTKLAPPPPPTHFRASATPLRLESPGRPPELRIARRGERTPKQEALEQPYYRARTLHAFLHHELQAAELMCWAILAFPEAEREFRRGLLAICLDELRHLQLYAEHIRRLGCNVGDFGVRDWFWKRVPCCQTKLEFVAVMGMGLEAANLEYAPDFAARFRLAGDERGAEIQERIAAEEVAHVGFATRWFSRWTGGCDFDAWAASLPPPLSPWVMHGNPIALEARRRAGMSEEFPESARGVRAGAEGALGIVGRLGMSQRFAWVLNLDAELELSRGRPGYVPQRKLVAQLAEHGQSSRQLLGPSDVLLDELAAGAALSSHFVGRAWCPTPMALAKLRSFGVQPEPHPSAALLRRVNHRSFGHELGGGLPGQAYVTSRAELESHVGNYARTWLLKRPLSFAGRGQLRIIGPLTDKQWTWVDASFARDGLLLEPLVQPTLELSLHGFVWPSGKYRLGRICTQQVSERGAFRSVRRAEASELLRGEGSALEERAAAVAEALNRAGYFGPFGIDAYRYAQGGASAFCALGEVNARYTLGFCTGFPEHPSQLSLG